MYAFTLLLFALAAGSSYGKPQRHVEMTHLVTMRRAELIEIVNCVSEARNPMLCQQFMQCEMLMAKQVIVAFQRCVKKILPEGRGQCTKWDPLLPSPAVAPMIFDCIDRSVNKLTPEERGDMVAFEICSRKVYGEGCRAHKYYH